MSTTNKMLIFYFIVINVSLRHISARNNPSYFLGKFHVIIQAQMINFFQPSSLCRGEHRNFQLDAKYAAHLFCQIK